MEKFPQQFEALLSQKEKTFSYFLLHFENVHETSHILKKKDEYPSLVISKIIDSERSGYLIV